MASRTMIGTSWTTRPSRSSSLSSSTSSIASSGRYERSNSLNNREPPQVFPRRTELRLAVVYNGGMSLATYSFAQSCEIRQLWLGSQAFDRAMANVLEHGKDLLSECQRERPNDGTARVYFDLFRLIWQESNVHISVRIDIISGTGTGSVNAVLLGKSLMTGCDVRKLNEFWLQHADMNQFAHESFADRSLSRQVLGWSAGMVAGLVKTRVLGDARLPVSATNLRYGVQAAVCSKPLLDGAKLQQTLAAGLSLMDQASEVERKYCAMRSPLAVFTSLTASQPILHPVSKDQQYSLQLRFDNEQFTWSNINRELSFAARAGCALPVAFQSTSLEEGSQTDLLDCQGQSIAPVDPSKFLRSQLHPYTVDYQQTTMTLPEPLLKARFADGGNLVNKPLKATMLELNRKRERLGTNCQRRILLLEPKPSSAIEPASMSGSPNDEVELFALMDKSSFGPVLEKIQARFDTERSQALVSRPGLVSRMYDWLPNIKAWGNAAMDNAVQEEQDKVKQFNRELRRANDFTLRALHRLKVTAWDRFGHVQLGNHHYVRAFWYGDMPFNPQHVPRDMLYFAGWKLTSQDEQMIYLDARFDEFRRSMADVLAGPNYLHFPVGSFKQQSLVNEKMPQYFPKPPIASAEDGFDRLVENDLFFLRDCLSHVVSALENPSLLADQVAIKSTMWPFIYQISRFVQGNICELDRLIALPPDDWRVSNNEWENWTSQTMDSIRMDWKRKFAFTLENVLMGVEQIIHSVPREEEKSLRQLVYRPLFTHSFLEITTFPVLSQLGVQSDNAVTKTTRLSPDSIDDSPGPATALFHDARKIIRNQGLPSVSQIFMESSDASQLGGLTDRRTREFDYVWGRLDATEQLCKVVLDAAVSEANRETRDTILATGGRLEFFAKRRLVDRVKLPRYCFDAARVVLDEELSSTMESCTISDKDNRQFFSAMLHQVESKVREIQELQLTNQKSQPA